MIRARLSHGAGMCILIPLASRVPAACRKLGRIWLAGSHGWLEKTSTQKEKVNLVSRPWEEHTIGGASLERQGPIGWTRNIDAEHHGVCGGCLKVWSEDVLQPLWRLNTKFRGSETMSTSRESIVDLHIPLLHGMFSIHGSVFLFGCEK
jgi:hypothetical protein